MEAMLHTPSVTTTLARTWTLVQAFMRVWQWIVIPRDRRADSKVTPWESAGSVRVEIFGALLASSSPTILEILPSF